MLLCKEDYDAINEIMTTGVNVINSEYGNIGKTAVKFKDRRGYSLNGISKTALGRNLKSIYTLPYRNGFIQLFNYTRYDGWGLSKLVTHIEYNVKPYCPRYFNDTCNENGYTYRK